MIHEIDPSTELYQQITHLLEDKKTKPDHAVTVLIQCLSHIITCNTKSPSDAIHTAKQAADLLQQRVDGLSQIAHALLKLHPAEQKDEGGK